MDGGYVYEKGETIKTVESSRIGCTILRWIDVTLITYLTELIMQKGITHDDWHNYVKLWNTEKKKM